MALFAFDGTWNERKTDDDLNYRNTNVLRFHEVYQKNSGRNEFYVEGVGTRYDILGKIVGGVFGAGVFQRLDEAYDHLCQAWASGDQDIDIIGFSRGAATALDFCHVIQERGIRAPGTEAVIVAEPRIRFLGLWDVVAAFGLANLGIGINIGHHLALPKPRLKYCCHALALDERRPPFVATRLPGASEVWFRGVHSDIGGGNGNRGLNDVSMKWMMSKAKAAGLPITEADIRALRPQPETKPHLKKALVLKVRHISKVDRIHYTVTPFPNATMPPVTCPRETVADEAQITDLAAGIEIFPDEVRRRINVLVAQAHETASQQFGIELGETSADVTALIQHRISLVQSEADLARARQSTADLVATMIAEMRKRQMVELSPFFLTAALFKFDNLFPYSD